MAQTNYVLTKATNNAGESQVNLRLYVSRDVRIRAASGIWLDRKRWGKKNDINIPLTLGEERDALLEKRAKLKALTDMLEAEINSAPDKSVITREWVERLVKKFHKPTKAAKERVKDFFDVMDDYLTKHKLSESRTKHFSVLVRCLRRYELYKRAEGNRGFKLNINALTHEQLSDIESFLSNEHEIFTRHLEIYETVPYSIKQAVKTVRKAPASAPKERGQNYISDMMTRLRSFVIWANDNSYTTNSPFKGYPIGESVYGTPIYISNEERRQLYEADLSGVLAVQRDIFVFQCLIGCRVSDLYKFTLKNVINGAIEYIPRKTHEDRVQTVRVPLSETALAIMERHRDPNRESLLPFISSQKYNDNIKEAFRLAGLDRMVTVIDQRTRQEVHKPLFEVASSHMARRTFIGNIYKKVKDPNLVGALSGHKEGSKAFARYRDIDEDMKRELIGFLE